MDFPGNRRDLLGKLEAGGDGNMRDQFGVRIEGEYNKRDVFMRLHLGTHRDLVPGEIL